MVGVVGACGVSGVVGVSGCLASASRLRLSLLRLRLDADAGQVDRSAVVPGVAQHEQRALRAPSALGLNLTVTVQVAAGSSVLPLQRSSTAL